MRRWGWMMLAGVWLCAGARAAAPDAQVFPAAGDRLLLWVASERGRSEPELAAAAQLAARGVEVWSLDAVAAYFLPQLPSSMEAVPVADLTAWLANAEAAGKQVTVYAVARAAVPVLRAAAQLAPAARSRLCVLLMYPNLYTQAEPLAEPDYLEFGDLSGLRVRVLQPRRSAATPWLARQTAHLAAAGATVDSVILENLREAFWARETPTDFETAESRRFGDRLLDEMDAWGCR